LHYLIKLLPSELSDETEEINRIMIKLSDMDSDIILLMLKKVKKEFIEDNVMEWARHSNSITMTLECLKMGVRPEGLIICNLPHIFQDIQTFRVGTLN